MLVRLIDKVIFLLESGKYPYYMLDGQTIMLQDYNEIRPQNYNRLVSLIKQKKLIAGPWYVVPDTLIVSGESLIKNLEIGSEILKEYQGEQSIAYTPDSFGMASQMPQIFNLFGFKGAMFTRGYRSDNQSSRCELIWESPDGSQIPTVFDYYNLGICLTVPTIWNNFDRTISTKDQVVQASKDILNILNEKTESNNLLLIVGIDHFEPRREFADFIEYLNEQHYDYEFIHSTLKDYFTEMINDLNGNYNLISGEQRGPYKEHFVLGNTLSSRMDLKILNRRAENQLTYLSQQLYAVNPQTDGYIDVDTGDINKYAWKCLIQNHAHDSICTCSSDETLKDVQSRFKHSLELSREVVKLECKRLGESISGVISNCAIVVYNPLAFNRTALIDCNMLIPFDISNMVIADQFGNPLEDATIEIEFQKRIDIESMKANEYDEVRMDTTRDFIDGITKEYDVYSGVKVCFIAENVPPMGYNTYYLVEKETNAKENNFSNDNYFLENSFLRVDVNEDGTINVLNKQNGKRITNTHYFEEMADEGDTYTFSPLENDPCMTTKGKKANSIKYNSNSNYSELIIEHTLIIPKNIDERINKTFNVAEVRIISKLKLSKYSDVLDITTTINNQACDHRLRAIFNMAYKIDVIHSDTAFDMTCRPVYDKSELTMANIMTMPLRNVVCANGANSNFAIFSDGPQEYEAQSSNNETTIALTLLRCVGRIYSMKTYTKNETEMGTGVRWWTEDAQMLGEIVMRYGIKLYDNVASFVDIMNDALSFSVPLYSFGSLTLGIEDPSKSFCNVENAVLSSYFTNDLTKNTVYVRIFNPSKEDRICKLKLGYKVRKVTLVDLCLKKIEIIKNTDFEFSYSIRKGQIATFEIVKQI